MQISPKDNMTHSYDLTTTDGWKNAVAYLRDVPVLGTLWAHHFYVLDKIFEAVGPGNAVEKLAKAASDLIRAGKENGVKKMKVTMDEKAGAHLDVPTEGVKLSASLGTQGKTIIEVEYK